ncbi:DNA/RNA non-specific endonuclease [Geodermatophilus sp. SYSU D00758]
MTDSRLEGLRRRLAASPDLAEAVRTALAGGRLPSPFRDAVAEDAAEAVAADRRPLEGVVPTDALEAIVQRVGRPPLLVRDDAVELEPLADFPAGTEARIKEVQSTVRSVGRVEFLNHRLGWGGTGWVIADDGGDRLVATNRHVAALVARRAADGRGVLVRNPASGARYGVDVDFREEVGSLPADARPFPVRDVVHLADEAAPDVALLRITGSDLPGPLDLATGEAAAGDLVALIGYPAFDSRNDVDDQARYFRDLYDVKRFAPGRVVQALSGRTVLSHDCTSLGGNSGSPLIGLEDGRVVGLHFAGVYGVANSAVGVRTLQALLSDLRSPIVVVPSRLRPDDAEARGDGTHSPDQLRDRGGYDPDFLGDGLTAPWPGLPPDVERDLAHPSDEVPERPGELRYTHFGVRFSTARRQPVVTAVNIDGRHSVRVKRGRDRWFRDGRLPVEVQLGREDYAHPDIDRGHMVRREDPNWDPAAGPGDESALARQANGDTFHYTNAAPQHAEMNQAAEMWLGLEDHVLDSARTHGFRACVFTGPVARDDDPEIRPGVLVPREFWKVVAMRDADRRVLHATAYLLSQGDLIRELLERRDRREALEGFVLGPYRTFQLAVRDLADATGLDLSSYVGADPLTRTVDREESAGAAPPRFLPLESLADVVT